MRSVALVLVVSGIGILAAACEFHQMIARDHMVQFNKAFDTLLQDTQAECAASLDVPALLPIRDNVELLHENTITPPPYSMLSNRAVPKGDEVPALAHWLEVRNACMQRLATRINALRLSPDIDGVFWPTLPGLMFQTANAVSDLLVVLYQGKLSYGDFAKHRHALAAAAAEGELRYRHAMVNIVAEGGALDAATSVSRRYADRVQAEEKFIAGLNAIIAQRPPIPATHCTVRRKTVECAG